MPAKRQYSRVVLEFNLGRQVTAQRWREIQSQMKQSGMPLTAKNMIFVAKIKKMAPRYRLSSEVLNDCVSLASLLGEKAIGLDIKREIYKLRPKLSRSKFYYWFNKCGFPFCESKEYEISYLGEVFYKLIGGR
jgi:hypothetical protein